MNEWPNGWSGDQSGNRYGHGSGSTEPEGARAMPQVRRDAGPGYQRHEPPLPPSMSPRRGGSVPPQQSQGYDDAVARRLVATNWLRTAAWTAGAGCSLLMVGLGSSAVS